jgi:8-oxo-dGTP pyrophosphatase MutT (NUDIX family)/predicted N-acetyltransferase YhbS
MLTYQRANPEDILPALTLWFETWDELIVPENVSENHDYENIAQNSGLLKKYADGERFMLIALDENKIVGTVGADVDTGFIKPPVCVNSEYHRQGIASELLHRMVCELKLSGCDLIKVDSSKYALPFYQKFGFVQTGSEQQHDGFVSIPMEYTPNEIWDVLDAEGNKTGRVHERGRKMASEDFHLVVHVWKHNGRGEWLIDKRASNRGTSIDGKWETTGGAAIAGDDSLTAALREVKEELGLELDPNKGTLFHRIKRRADNDRAWIQDAWVFEHDCSLAEVRFQESETCDVMWASAAKIKDMMAEGEFMSEWFYPYFDELVEKWA